MMVPADQAIELETTVCPMCGSNRTTCSPYVKPPFQVVRCTACNLWYLNPRLAADVAAAYYESDEYFSSGDVGYGDYAAQESSLRTGFRALLARLERLRVTGGRLLEVGCGYGYFLDESRKYFDERIGIEPSPAAAHAAGKLTGAIVLTSIDELPTEKTFDFVFASHVIEHIYKPVSFTKQLIAHLRPDGVIVYTTPDMNSFWRKLMGQRWPSFKYPEHVSFFDSDTLPRLFDCAGAISPRRIRILDRFPLSEILAKIKLPAPGFSARIDAPIPATSVCVMARAPERAAK